MMKFAYLLLFVMAGTACKTSSPSALSSAEFKSSDRFTHLSAGLYWYGADVDQWSYYTDPSTDYFDPTKNTLIIVRGWGKGEVEEGRNETLNYKSMGGPDLSVTDAWIKQGWNVGYINWNQFSDEKEVKDAEAKIWTYTAWQKMRWIDKNLVWHAGPNETVIQMMADAMETALAHYRGRELRIVGHSLGAQLAVGLIDEFTTRAQQDPRKAKLIPTRLALIEPVFTKGGKDYLGGKTNSEYATAIVERAVNDRKLPVEIYACSGLILGMLPVLDQTHDIWQQGLFAQRMLPTNITALEFGKAHAACLWQYMLSIAGPTASVMGFDNIVAGGAKQSDQTIISWSKNKKWLKQIKGPNVQDTPVYEVRSW